MPEYWMVSGEASYVDDRWMMATSGYMPGTGVYGSSGMFMAKVALFDFEVDVAVLAGVPLTDTPHCHSRKGFPAASTYQKRWQGLPVGIAARVRSMSGWTAGFLGEPDKEWLNG